MNIGGMCCTIRTGTGRCEGSCGRTVPSAVGPPVDTPIAITSTRATGPAAGERGAATTVGRIVPSAGASGQSVRILGRSSSRILAIASVGLAVPLGLTT